MSVPIATARNVLVTAMMMLFRKRLQIARRLDVAVGVFDDALARVVDALLVPGRLCVDFGVDFAAHLHARSEQLHERRDLGSNTTVGGTVVARLRGLNAVELIQYSGSR